MDPTSFTRGLIFEPKLSFSAGCNFTEGVTRRQEATANFDS